MRSTRGTALYLCIAVLATAGRAGAQTAGTSGLPPLLEPFSHGVPSGTATATALSLSLLDAVNRGLDHNLGVLLQEDRVSTASGERWKALGDVLPKIGARVADTDEKINLAAFGFTGLPGVSLPNIVGPFSVFDARIAASMPIFDREASGDLHKEEANERAEQHTYRYARELVILAVANLYMQGLADKSRVDAVRAQADLADTLLALARDQQSAGLVAGIDVVRQQVEVQTAKQRVIAAENEFAKQKLRLARAIGLPVGQAFDLTGALAYEAAPAPTAEAALALAYSEREDLKTADERVQAAVADQQASRGAMLPKLRFDADYGTIGPTPAASLPTFTATASLRIPIFEGGETHGRVLEADADVKAREAERDDVKAGIAFEVQSALLDISAADAAVGVAKSGLDLANQQVTQARDRFAAGVGGAIELAQAQDSVAAANDTYIAALYQHMMAKAELAHAIGAGEDTFMQYLGAKR